MQEQVWVMLDRDTLDVDMLVCYPGSWEAPFAMPLTPYIAILCLEHSACCSQAFTVETLSSSIFDLSARWTSFLFPSSLSAVWGLGFFHSIQSPSCPHHIPIKSLENFLGFILSYLQAQLQITINRTSFNVTLTFSPGFTSSRSITLNSLPSRLRRKDLGLPWSF